MNGMSRTFYVRENIVNSTRVLQCPKLHVTAMVVSLAMVQLDEHCNLEFTVILIGRQARVSGFSRQLSCILMLLTVPDKAACREACCKEWPRIQAGGGLMSWVAWQQRLGPGIVVQLAPAVRLEWGLWGQLGLCWQWQTSICLSDNDCESQISADLACFHLIWLAFMCDRQV
ncbi:hypothetical protein B0H34DRAFT_708639 [Crassisporium funariophilum]|nr:hypothetical protein B0H34DRAFT_708639 [Crassisporium funariophilum]